MKRYWPAIAGALLFALSSAASELFGLRALLRGGFTHWKFGTDSYYHLSIWAMQWLFLLQAVLFLIFGLGILRLSPRLPWYACLLFSIVAGVLVGLEMIRLHRHDLHLPPKPAAMILLSHPAPDLNVAVQQSIGELTRRDPTRIL